MKISYLSVVGILHFFGVVYGNGNSSENGVTNNSLTATTVTPLPLPLASSLGFQTFSEIFSKKGNETDQFIFPE